MKNSKALKIYLGLAGSLLTFIGGSTLLMPVDMKAGAGIDISGNISLINDVRASSALLLGMGLMTVAGVMVKRLTYTSNLVSVLAFLTLGVGRLISILVDGTPVDGLIKATGLEFVLGIVGLALFWAKRERVLRNSNFASGSVRTGLRTGTSIMLLGVSVISLSQEKTDKRVITFSVERVIDAPVGRVWAVVGEDFGAIANSHPKIVSSNYDQGYTTGGENVTRTCHFNEKGSKYLQEKQVSFNDQDHTFKVLIHKAGGIPINTEYSYGVYSVKPVDAKSCRLVMQMGVRTKPSFLGGLAKGQFKRDIADYLLAVEHHVLTGENVNKENFKEIKKKYKKQG